MASHTRETRAIARIKCPRCDAWPGTACFVNGKPGRSAHGGPFAHPERIQAWVAAKPTCPVCEQRHYPGEGPAGCVR